MENHLDAGKQISSHYWSSPAKGIGKPAVRVAQSRCRQRVLQPIGMLVRVALNAEVAGKACKLACSGIRHDGDKWFLRRSAEIADARQRSGL